MFVTSYVSMKYKAYLFSLIFLALLILVVVSQELSSAESGDHLMYAEDSSDSSVQFVEDDRDQSFIPQHESAEDYAVTSVEFYKSKGTLAQIYYATPGTQVDVGIDIEVQHDNFSYNLNVRVELRSVADSNSSDIESHGTKENTIYTDNPYRAFAGPFTLLNDSDVREYFVKLSVRLPDDSWAIIYDEKDSSFPDGRLSTKNPMAVDTDNDGLSDGKEIELGTSLTVNDTDNDGLNDSYEVDLDTDPLDNDTDGDGLNDGHEVDLDTDPLDNDTDGDGLNDGHEVSRHKLDALNNDTDNDGLNDSYEVDLGTDPLHWDTDGDYLSDGDEVDLGTDPFDRDTDGDGLSDGDEVDLGRDPRVPDGASLTYGSLVLFLGIFSLAFFIVTVIITRRGTKR